MIFFTSVCQEFCPRGGGCLPQCMLGYTPPPPGAHPQSRQPPWDQTTPPRTRHPPEQTPPGADTPLEQTPPGKQTAAYGQWAAGTHPTGIHSCLGEIFLFVLWTEYSVECLKYFLTDSHYKTIFVSVWSACSSFTVHKHCSKTAHFGQYLDKFFMDFLATFTKRLKFASFWV